MKRKIILMLVCFFSGSFSMLSAWGIWGHQHINRAAIFALPDEMRIFFYNHADFVTEESIIPDVRKYTLNDKAEGPRHFIDVEGFNTKDINDLPRTMKDATAKYADSTLQKYGILPWYIQQQMEKLTNAFRDKKKTEILFLAADLGHYLGDAHMPLHTSLNYDGQLTDQKGIHAFWESQLPELFGSNFNLNTAPAHHIDDVTKETWRIIESSHRLVDTLLMVEKNLKDSFPKDKIYVKDSAGNVLKTKYNQTVHTKEYAEKYHQALNGMVEKQMKAAIIATANFWYTAWVNAGKPDLNDLDPKSLTERNARYYKEDLKLWEEGKLTGIKTGTEF